MATYLANPDYQSYQFTPYVPPYQETLQAIQARSQYWLEGASRVKGAFDNVISKEYTRDDSKAKINQFRQEVEPKLEQIAQKDLSIGSIQRQAFNIIDPIRKDKGLLVDEHTTTLKNEIIKAAQADAVKNGGKYYNQYSVQYANQIAERYKNATSAEDQQYAEVLQSNPYMPYDPKANENIHNRVKSLMSQTRTYDVRPGDGTLRRVTEPRYSISQALAILEETASPQEKSLIQLMGKTQFNAMQLAAGQDTKQLQKIGQLYKSQIDAEFNDKIAWKTSQKLDLEARYNSYADNDPLKKQFEKQYQENKSILEKEIEELKIQKEGITQDYFADPAMWRMGEQYASALYNTQHYRNLAVALTPGDLGTKIVKDDAYWEAMKLNAKTVEAQVKAEAERKKAEAEAMTDIQLPTITNLTVSDYDTPEQAARDVRARMLTLGDEESRQFSKILFSSLDITPIDENNVRQDLSTILEKTSGSTKLSDVLTGISAEGRKNLEELLKATGTSNLKEDIGDMTVQQVQSVLGNYLRADNKEAFLNVARKAGMNNGSIDMIATLYNRKNEIDNVISNEKANYGKVYKNALAPFIPEGNATTIPPTELFKFGSRESISNIYGKQIDSIAKEYNLNSAQKELVLDYLVGERGAENKINEQIPSINVGERRGYVLIPGGSTITPSAGTYEVKVPIFDRLTSIKDNITKGNKALDTALTNQLNQNNGRLGFSVIQKVFNVVPEYNSNTTRARNITTGELESFLDQGNGITPGGTSEDENQKRLEYIKRNQNILSYAERVKFRNAPGSNPWMEIIFNTEKISDAVKSRGLDDKGKFLFFGTSDAEKLKEKTVKIFFANPSDVETRIQGVSDEIEQFTGNAIKNYDFISGNKLEVANKGVGNNIDVHFNGKMMRYEPYQNGMVRIGEIEVSRRDQYDTVSRVITPNSTRNFNQLRMRLPDSPEISRLTQALTSHDARATILKQEIEANPEIFQNYIKQENGEILLDLQGLQRGNPQMYNKLVNIMSNGRY